MPFEALGQPALQREGLQDCAVARALFCAFVFVFVFGSLLFSIFIDPRRASHTLG
jgi:hypothetical protein